MGRTQGDVVNKQSVQQPGHFHAVQFYNDPASLSRMVAGFLAEGFTKGDAAVIIATPDHRLVIERDLRAAGIDVDTVKRLGELVVLDARETLNTFMVDGVPHGSIFKHVLGEVLTQINQTHPECTIRAYGEMVNVLWKDGLEAAAIRLETLWNELATTHDFKLLCGYSMGNFYKGAALEDIKVLHSHVVTDPAATATIN
jgi:hypothetical protein